MNDYSPPLVSIIIATYNRANVLGRSVRSVLHQSYQNFEILIVDDKSTDNTQQIAEQFADERIRFLRHEANQGQSAAHNTGIHQAEGVYVAFLDSDDEWPPSMLEKCLRKFMQYEDLGVVYTWTGTRQLDGRLKVVNKFSISGWIYKEALAQGYVSHSISMVIKRECFDKIGLWDDSFQVCQDDDICLRLAKEFRFGLVPEILAVIHLDERMKSTVEELKDSAVGYARLFSKYESEIRRICGDEVMASHWIRCAKYFLLAEDKNMAHTFIKRAYELNPCRQYRVYPLFAEPLRWLLKHCKRLL